MQNSQQEESCKQNEKNSQPQNKVVKKKRSLLKKKKMPPTRLFSNIDLKHAVNINDICFVNQQALRYPENSEETLLKTLFHYKMISKVTLNPSFVTVQMKKNDENLLPPEYFFDRFRSFGDQQLANIANHLEKIHHTFNILQSNSRNGEQTHYDKEKQQLLLQNFLREMEGKKYLIYFSQITPERINMRNILFSVPLLQELGFNMNNIALDFLKYKHVFFEVFTTKKYGYFIQNCLDKFGKVQKTLLENPNLTLQERKQLFKIQYKDQIIRRVSINDEIQEETVEALVTWTTPHPSICCFQIKDLQQVPKVYKRKKVNNFLEADPETQLANLKSVGIETPFLQIQTQKNQKKELENQEQPPLQNINQKSQSEKELNIELLNELCSKCEAVCVKNKS